MIKFRHLILIAILSVLAYACGSDSTTSVENFDHAAQALKDNDTLVSFLKKHYYNTQVDSVKPLVAGATALYDDPKLMIQNVTENEVDYKLYYYVQNEGTPDPVMPFPTVADSVFVNYYGQRIVNTDSISNPFDSNKTIWFTLGGSVVNGRPLPLINGWNYGFTHFKGGKNITDNGPITYQNYGKGILFIPSGLAYLNRGSRTILPNECLLFYIDLLENKQNTDADKDGVPSMSEDLDTDGRPWSDDTDGDGLPNYLDADDDGDGIPTINEDANGDGDPTNDFSDPNNPTLPDYLNNAIRNVS